MGKVAIVWDLETTGTDPVLDTTNIIQIAATAIDLKKLEKIPDSNFLVNVCPDGLGEEDFYEKRKNTIDFHIQNQRKSLDELLQSWSEGVKEKKAWKMFKEYCDQYNYDKKFYSMPLPAGKNIINYDLKIADRLNEKYKFKEFFFRRDVIDLDHLCTIWFMFHLDPPNNNKMDTLRPYFGMSSEKAHDAAFDVAQEADLILKFLSLHKRICNQIQFRDSFLRV